MIFFVDNNGKIINSQPETVYQGAADTNNIYLIAPFAANLSFAVAFKLPNGVYTERYLMTQGGQLEDIEYSPTQNIFALWKMSVPSNITQYFGTVKAQFYAYATNGAITATSATSFVVSQGVPEELPATPSQDIYNQILTALSQIQSQLNNGTFAARAIYWWIDTFTYGMNEITFYPLGEYGALIRSVATNNEGNAPYDDEGNLNSAYWQELVDFNKALNAIEEAAKSAAEAAQSATESAQSAAQSAESASAAAASEQNAAQSAQNAATSESNAAQSAEDAEQSAQDAAQSAQQAESSATDAAQSAVDAAESAQEVIDYLGKTTVFVTELPEVGDPNLLYFVTGDSDNLFSIYTYKDGEWKLMGESNLVINDTNTYLSALSASSWQSNRQTVSLTGLTPDDSVIVTPGNGYADEYIQYGISPVEIINGGIIFSCTSLPPVSIALVIEVTKEQTIPTATGYYTKPQTDSLINAEKSAREAADTNLQNNITAEATARQQADESLQSAITAEASARQSADSTLQQNITAEAQARTAADTALGDRIDDLVDGTTAAGKAVADGNGNNIVDTYATQSIVNNGLAQKQDITDNSLDTTSKTVVGAINENKAAIDGLRNDMVATDHFKGFAATAADVQKISGDLNDYVYCIATGTIWTYGADGWADSGEAYPSDATPLGTTTPLMDGTGAAGSSSSAARADHVHPTDTSRASASALQSEVSARQQADQTLQSSISAEATARQSADQTLQTNITNEATARANADTALGNRIDELVNGTTAVANATNAVSAQSAATATNATNAENAVNATNAQAAATAQTADTATTAEKVAHKLTIITGDTTVEFDGSSDQSVQIEIGDSNDPNAVHFTQQTLTAEQQAQARTNISSASESALTAETNARTSADTALGNRVDNVISGATPVAQATNSTNATNAANDSGGNNITSFYAHNLTFTMDSSTYVLTATLLNGAGEALATQSVDLPLESVVVSGEYDSDTKEVVLTLRGGSEVRFSVADLVDGLASQSALNAVINGTTPVAKATSATTADKVANALTINGEKYDGSQAVNIEVGSDLFLHCIRVIQNNSTNDYIRIYFTFYSNRSEPFTTVEEFVSYMNNKAPLSYFPCSGQAATRSDNAGAIYYIVFTTYSSYPAIRVYWFDLNDTTGMGDSISRYLEYPYDGATISDTVISTKDL